MMQGISCLIFRELVPACAVLQADVIRVVSISGWSNDAPPLDITQLGIHVPAGVGPERVLLLQAERGPLPLLVRGLLTAANIEAAELAKLPKWAFARSAFSGVITRDESIDAFLLDPNRLIEKLTS